MLTLNIPLTSEGWDEEKQEFVEPQCAVLELEHSLVSLSTWESKWCKSFLFTKSMTYEETIDYIKCMTLTPNVDPNIYKLINDSHINQVSDYISASMTATTFREDKKSKKDNRIITNELIYYWMTALNIPAEYQHWHLNRLLTLIRVASAESNPPKKKNQRELLASNAALNAARRKQLNSKG